jgi:hypothetical protein
MVQTVTGWRMDHRAGRYSDRAMALAMASLFAVESASTTITPDAMANWRELLADLGSRSAGGGSHFGDVVGIPGVVGFDLEGSDGRDVHADPARREPRVQSCKAAKGSAQTQLSFCHRSPFGQRR